MRLILLVLITLFLTGCATGTQQYHLIRDCENDRIMRAVEPHKPSNCTGAYQIYIPF